MTGQELGTAIENAWNEFSYNLLMNSEGKDYKISDIAKAFHEGAESVLLALGYVDKAGGEYVK